MDVKLSPSTWSALGLNVAVGYLGLGTLALTQSTLSAKLFNIHPESDELSNSSSKKPVTAKGGEVATRTDHGEAVRISMLLLGARDVSIGLGLLALWYKRRPREMGIVISGGMVLCAVDTWWIWKARGPVWGGLIGAGAVSWMFTGLGLLGLTEAESW